MTEIAVLQQEVAALCTLHTTSTHESLTEYCVCGKYHCPAARLAAIAEAALKVEAAAEAVGQWIIQERIERRDISPGLRLWLVPSGPMAALQEFLALTGAARVPLFGAYDVVRDALAAPGRRG